MEKWIGYLLWCILTKFYKDHIGGEKGDFFINFFNTSALEEIEASGIYLLSASCQELCCSFL